jgi:CspA family cold shock protein
LLSGLPGPPPKLHPTVAESAHDDGRRYPALTNEGHNMASMTGTIKRLVSDKGFGFILAGDGSEYFFHNSACQQTAFDDLREGQAVTFDMGHGPKGPRGENVRLA